MNNTPFRFFLFRRSEAKFVMQIFNFHFLFHCKKEKKEIRATRPETAFISLLLFAEYSDHLAMNDILFHFRLQRHNNHPTTKKCCFCLKYRLALSTTTIHNDKAHTTNACSRCAMADCVVVVSFSLHNEINSNLWFFFSF